MANPQKENGHTQIANEILEAFAKTKIGGKKQQLLLFIIRKTYGFNKKQDRISLSQFSKGTGLVIRDVCRCINQLESMKLILKIKDDKGNIYGLNKDYDQWTELSVVKNVSCQKCESATDKIVHQPLTKMSHTKETITKDNITKDITTKVVRAKAQPREDINILLNGIKQLVGVMDGSQQEQRNFAKNFLDSKTPEILRRAGNLNPTTQQIINATLRIFQLATKDDFHRKNCNSIKYVYNKAAAIALSGKNNQPKIIKV